ncbi:MAG: transcription termination factor NusA [Bacilli bacterium]|nr:transcription termination factor NusA [Bacilli bacterium]
MISKNFFESLESIAFERKLEIEDVMKKVETAMGVACRHTNPPHTGEIILELNDEKKQIRVFEIKRVVEEVDPEGPRGQILLEEALELRHNAKIGMEIKSEVTMQSFGRKAASNFKQNLLNGLKDLERERAYTHFSERIGEVITGRVLTSQSGFVTFGVGQNVEAHMPLNEGLPGEDFFVGQEKKLYITKVEKTGKGPKVYVSRKNKEIVKRLFEMTIPEIKDGTIEIMGLARDPGSRTKIGVASRNSNVDPKGACVGPGGLRIRSINESLNNEKIDIFTWRENPVELICEALLPAKVVSVIMNDEKERRATVIVSDDQFSLAIGKQGQNARLAAYAINWHIDIKKLSEATEEGIKFKVNV